MAGGVTIVCHWNEEERLNRHLLASLAPQRGSDLQVLLYRGLGSITRAYARGEAEATHDLVIYVHQDTELPTPWIDKFLDQVACVTAMDPDWGAIGVFGTFIGPDGRQGYAGNLRDTFEHRAFNLAALPLQVQTLDGLLIAKRRGKPTGIAWDEGIPGFDGYDVDMSLQCAKAGKRVWVVNCFTEHACRHRDLATDAPFQASKAYLLTKWKQRPIPTSCEVWW